MTRNGWNNPLGAYEQYLIAVHGAPAKTPERECALLEVIARGRVEQACASPDSRVLEAAKQARAELVELSQPMVIYMVNKYRHKCRHMEYMDLIQEGNLGLLHAFEVFDFNCSRGSFSSFALTCIRYHVEDALGFHDSLIRLPANKVHELRRLKRARAAFFRLHVREASVEELAVAAEMTPAKVCDLLDLENGLGVNSLDAPFEGQDETGWDEVLSADVVLPAPGEADREMAVSPVVGAMLSRLPDGYRQVVEVRHGLHNGSGQFLSYTQVAQVLHIPSRTATSRYVRGLARLQAMSAMGATVGEGVTGTPVEEEVA